MLLISLNRSTVPERVFPLGLSYLSASLRQAGHDVRWFDCLEDPGSVEGVVSEYQPDFAGISLRNIDDVQIRRRETFFEPLAEVCEAIRRRGSCPVILGGSGFSLFPERLLELSGADYGIQGEGEESLVALVRALSRGEDPTRVAGLVYRHNGGIVANPPRRASEGVPLTSEDRPARLAGRYLEAGGMLNLQTQRGCSHVCAYCTYPLIEGRAARRRPPEAVAEEMTLLEAAGAQYVFLVDSIFNSSPQHVVETCEALVRRKSRMRWGCFLRPQGLTPELMRLMVRAGLAHIEFGSDSFCDAVLAAYAKHLTFEDILESSQLARAEQIDYCHYLICGGPGETWETLEAGFANSRRLPDAVVMAVVGMRIYPGTPLARLAEREGQIGRETDLLHPVYYLAPGLSAEAVFGRLVEFARASPNWIVGSADAAYERLVQRLRARGVLGPLWSYFALLQRLQPRPSVPVPA